MAATAVMGLLAGVAGAEPLDETLYAQILTRHTRPVEDLARTRVDYPALTRSPDWKQLVRQLERTAPAALRTREEQMAYWFNVYNILAIDLVVKGYPLESIRDLGSFFSPVWKQEAARVAGRPVTLHEIEHEILRPMGDPRIHVAIVCASLSCPALRREPWTASRLGAQLDEQLRRWLADPDKGLAVDRDAATLRLSRIFDWFEDDFEAGGGVLAFVSRYAPAGERDWLARHADRLRIHHLDYDWRLNDLAVKTPDG